MRINTSSHVLDIQQRVVPDFDALFAMVDDRQALVGLEHVAAMFPGINTYDIPSHPLQKLPIVSLCGKLLLHCFASDAVV